MITYEYVHEKTGERIEKRFSMVGDIPPIITENGKEYRRVFGNASVHIPFGFNQPGNSVKFNKSPSRRKHFW